jgi:hypothetical protein
MGNSLSHTVSALNFGKYIADPIESTRWITLWQSCRMSVDLLPILDLRTLGLFEISPNTRYVCRWSAFKNNFRIDR